MDREQFQSVVLDAAVQRRCFVVGIDFNDDDNVFEVVISKENGEVDLEDCEHVHRAVLTAFDRNVEDYALTVSSAGMDPAEADELLKTIKD